jgi:hypothetical protein
MIAKLQICVDGKIIFNKFSINQYDNKILVTSCDCKNNIIKVPVYNQFNGLDYVGICFPLELNILNKKILHPYIILSSYNFKIDNDLDFFKCLESQISNNFGYNFINFNDLDSDQFKNFNLIKILNEIYPNVFGLENLKNDPFNLSEFIGNFWFDINLIKLCIIFILIKYPILSNKNLKEIAQKHNIGKKILTIANQIRNVKYKIINNTMEQSMCFSEYIGTNFLESLKLTDIKPNSYYYIVVNKNDLSNVNDSQIVASEDQTSNTNKVIKIFIKKINKNIISLSEIKNILFENYKWYYYHPLLNINKNYIIYQTYISNEFTEEVIKNLLGVEQIHANKILEYYQKDNKISNLMVFQSIFDNTNAFINDMEILKSNSYNNAFFEYITKKYSLPDSPKPYEILGILFDNYNYPLKTNRHDMDTIFDNLLYFSLYNYKQILVNTKTNGFSNFSNEILHPNVNSIIPVKLKNLYINLLKVMSQVINGDFEAITYNQKFYSDYLHKNLIKLFFYDTNCLSIELFRSLISQANFLKFKNIVSTNLLLIDITNKITWSNLPKKLNYLNVFYKNDHILYYQDKLNKNIIPENFDVRIKKVIENPFEMYRYLRKEKDFEKWTKFISEKIIQLYHVPISLSVDDLSNIGQMIYLLFNITEQNTKEQTYIKFIEFCNANNKLVLDSNRINIKIRECFPNLRTNINLGFLAKHLTWNKESISFDENANNEKSQDVLALEMKLHIATKKYYKYKAKYLEAKDVDVGSALIAYKETQKIIGSETSSAMPGHKKVIPDDYSFIN